MKTDRKDAELFARLLLAGSLTSVVVPPVEVEAAREQRLHRVYHRMRGRGKAHNVIVVACARELACFLWAAATAD